MRSTYTVGPIPMKDGKGREIVFRVKVSGLDNKGREMVRRERNKNAKEFVAANYYPVTTALQIKDEQSQLTILTDTSQGGSGCLEDGALELMVHRTAPVDDRRGV